MLIVGFTYVSLFSGIGGFETALNALGGRCVFASEIDKHANKAYEVLYGESTAGDVTQIAAESVPDHDLLVGGFPCQAFSVAGKQLGFDDTRGTLFFEIARIARVKKPRMLLLENVKGLVSHDKGRTLDTIIQTLHDIGYTVDFLVLNSKYFGVPQNRERIFIVAIRNVTHESWAISKNRGVVAKAKERIQALGVRTFNFDWPTNDTVTTCIRGILEDSVDEKYYLSEEKTAKLISQLDEKDSDVRFVGGIDNGTKWLDDGKTLSRNFKQGNRVYDSSGIATTLTSQPVGGLGGFTSLYSVPNGSDMRQVGLLDMKGNESIRRVYSAEGISPTLTTMGGGHREPKVVIEHPQQFTDGGGISYCLDANYARGTSPGDVGKGRRTHVMEEARPVLTPDRVERRQKGRRFKENGEPAFTLTAQDRHGVALGSYPRYRIRKLTPLECFRLQGFPDTYYHALKSAGISDSQLYKMAGNAVTVNVISTIGRRLLPYLSAEIKEAA
ncbi:DNA (cytosine-5-)-methyltransferase [Brevibacillus laterosporus]|nr:DNA (cytosine-5-)-methyltransferase [Brevibacillus laterosporus]TPG88146.1 DNA (cytosine-5-)-methyltransferase [Brevibacillus laterosporus]